MTGEAVANDRPKVGVGRFVYAWGVGFPIAMTGAVSIAALQLSTGFRLRRLCVNRLLPMVSKACLKSFGIELRVHGLENIPEGQVIYTANHPSSLDMFLVSSMGLANVRSFLSKKTKKYPPIAILGRSIGAFFTPPQTEPKERALCFAEAERVLRETGDSVFLTPEGTRCPDGIGPFNKGTFHLASNMKVPLVPLFIDVPKEMNTGRTLAPLPGVVDIYVNPPICTSEWALDTLPRHRDSLRELYLAFPEGWQN